MVRQKATLDIVTSKVGEFAASVVAMASDALQSNPKRPARAPAKAKTAAPAKAKPAVAAKRKPVPRAKAGRPAK